MKFYRKLILNWNLQRKIRIAEIYQVYGTKKRKKPVCGLKSWTKLVMEIWAYKWNKKTTELTQALKKGKKQKTEL